LPNAKVEKGGDLPTESHGQSPVLPGGMKKSFCDVLGGNGDDDGR